MLVGAGSQTLATGPDMDAQPSFGNDALTKTQVSCKATLLAIPRFGNRQR